MTSSAFRKAAQQEFHHQIKEIRAQLFDQIKCLEQRTDVQVAILGEINDFVRKKAELDLDYSKQMDKLVKSVMLKHKNEKLKRANWPLHATCQLWQQLVDDAKEEARQRSITADVCVNYVSPAIAHRTMALQKIAKKCREIGVMAQGEVVRVLHELHTAMKTYQHCFAQYNALSGQLQQAEAQRNKVGSTSSTRKQRSAQKTYDKKSEKYASACLKCTRARNEYLLCIEAANASLHKFFADDISDLVDCTDLGMDWWLGLVLQNMITARKSACQVEMNALANLGSFKESVQSASDKQRFFESNHQTFMLPKSFDFKCDEAEHIGQITVAEGSLADEFRQRHHQIRRRLTTLRDESEMSWQSMEEAERQIRDLLSACTLVQVSEFGIATTAEDDRRKCENVDTELAKAYDAYLQPFSYYLHTANLIMRLAARADGIGNALNSLPPHQQQSAPATSSTSSVDDHHYQHQQHSSPSRLTVCGTSICSATGQLSEASKNGTVGPISVTSSSISTQKADHQQQLVDMSERCDSLEWAQRSRKKRIGSQASTELAHPPSNAVVVAAASGGPPTSTNAAHLWRRPRLFGGSLEEYTELTGEPIPLVVVSCIRILSQYALHHQGLFRISGSQLEINHMREAFESGEDPLREVRDANDANSIAGVLKLYLRELREPLFPFYLFDLLTDCAKCSSMADFISKICPLLNKLPRATYLLLRYLFAFLNHLSEFSDENMMDPYNLAICFGPTLLPIPEGKDQVHYQNSVNEVVKNLIDHSDAIFTARVPGPRYEKYASVESTDGGDGTPAGEISAELELFVDDELPTSVAHSLAPQLDNWPPSPSSTFQYHQQPHKRLSSADLPFPPPSPQFHRFHSSQLQASSSLSSASSPPSRQQQQQQRTTPLILANQVKQGDTSNNNNHSQQHHGVGSGMVCHEQLQRGVNSAQSASSSSAAGGGGGSAGGGHQPKRPQVLSPIVSTVAAASTLEAHRIQQQQQQQQRKLFHADNHVFNNNNTTTNTYCYSSTESGIAEQPTTNGTVATNSRPVHQQRQQFDTKPHISDGDGPITSTGDDKMKNVSDMYASIHKDNAPCRQIAQQGAAMVVNHHQQQQNLLKSPPPYNAIYGTRVLAHAETATLTTTSRRQSPPVVLREGPKGPKMISPMSSAYNFPSPTRRRNSFHDNIINNSSTIVASSVSAVQPHTHQHRPSLALDKPPLSTTIAQSRTAAISSTDQLKQQRHNQIIAIDELLGKLSSAASAGGDEGCQQQQRKAENAMDK